MIAKVAGRKPGRRIDAEGILRGARMLGVQIRAFHLGGRIKSFPGEYVLGCGVWFNLLS